MRNINIIKKDILHILDRYLGKDYLLIIFGSFIKGTSDRTSDIDLAVYRDRKIPSKIIVEIKEALDKKVHTLREIDLINLTDKGVNIDLLKNIVEEGVIWRRAKNSKELLRNLKRRLISIEK